MKMRNVIAVSVLVLVLVLGGLGATAEDRESGETQRELRLVAEAKQECQQQVAELRERVIAGFTTFSRKQALMTFQAIQVACNTQLEGDFRRCYTIGRAGLKATEAGQWVEEMLTRNMEKLGNSWPEGN